MSGGLGPRDEEVPDAADLAHAADETDADSAADARRADSSTPESDTERRQRSPSVMETSCTSVQRQCLGWIDEQPKPTGRTVVYGNARFDPGDMTSEQFWYIVEQCDAENQQILENRYRICKRNYMKERKRVFDLTFEEHFIMTDSHWLQTEVFQHLRRVPPT